MGGIDHNTSTEADILSAVVTEWQPQRRYPTVYAARRQQNLRPLIDFELVDYDKTPSLPLRLSNTRAGVMLQEENSDRQLPIRLRQLNALTTQPNRSALKIYASHSAAPAQPIAPPVPALTKSVAPAAVTQRTHGRDSRDAWDQYRAYFNRMMGFEPDPLYG